MKERDLFDAITETPDIFITEAGKTSLKKQIVHWQGWVAVAACIALIIGAVYAFHPTNTLVPVAPKETIGGTASLMPLLDITYPTSVAYYNQTAKKALRDNNPINETFVPAVNQFAYQTAAQLISNGTGNQNYAPLSLYYALALSATGADGETAKQFYNLLRVKDSETLSTQCGNLYRRLYTDNNMAQLKIANSLWMNQNIPFYKSFVQNAADQFYASTYSVDFGDKTTAQAMGQWIVDNTGGTLSPSIQTSPNHALTILNTVCFYDEWQKKFEESQTSSGDFLVDIPDFRTEMVTCKYMNDIRSGQFLVGSNYIRSSLQLKNGNSIVFILPHYGTSPRDLLNTPEQIQEIFEKENNGSGRISWKIPKFQFSSKFDLVSTLKTMGLTEPFQLNANFSKMTNTSTYISDIQQETTIGIDENGVTASAYTKIDFGEGGDTIDAAMHLDHTFAYGIVSSEGTLMFIGICEDPTAS